MVRKITTARMRKKDETFGAARNIILVIVLLTVVGFLYFRSVISHKVLDEETLCPSRPSSVTVLLVDVTDAMNIAQRQDFRNQLDQLADQIPRYGKLVIAKVDPVSDRLLAPIITRCNPGTAQDVSEFDGNPAKLEKDRKTKFIAPLQVAFTQLMAASGADRSPILESVQSVALTELQRPSIGEVPKRLIIASDLLQNTPEITFYNVLPNPESFISSQPFSRTRTDLRGTSVDLWMLQRDDSRITQPRALPELWEQMIEAQGGKVMRVYTVSG
jgi:hypothetical protein